MGHIRDLPRKSSEIPQKYRNESWARLGVRIDNGFEPIYVVTPDKKKVVRELKSALKEADELLIATDEDREGEAIGWHLLEVLRPTVPIRRMVFHEITKSAIKHALENARQIDDRLVAAQEARRVLDRLVGFEVSPVLWKKIRPKLSAGRVQSVAVRLLVMREKERLNFVPAAYWSVVATLEKAGVKFTAEMRRLGSQRLATGKDFDESTGTLKASLQQSGQVLVLSEEQARHVKNRARMHSGRSVRSKHDKRSVLPARRLSPPRCNRRPAGSSGGRQSRRCVSHKSCMRKGASLICERTRFSCRKRQ